MAKDTAKNNIGNLRNRCREIITGDEKMRIRNLLEEKRTEPVYVKYFDKLAFTIGVLNLFAMEFFLLNIPEHYWMFYLATLCPLLSYRCVYFYREKLQYFLIDLCYVVILLSMIHVCFFHEVEIIRKVLFIFSNGPLLFAIIVWGNSLVFHDFDRITLLTYLPL